MKQNQTKNLAISLKYSGGSNHAPKVTAKGQGWVAEKNYCYGRATKYPDKKG